MIKRGFSLLFLMILLSCCAQAGIMRHISPAELGGAQDVYHIVRTRDGFLWFCSDNGLFRFDGQHLDRYSTANGLPDNIILNLFEDYSGRLWLYCFNGAGAYLQNGIIHTSRNDPFLRNWPEANAYLMQVSQTADSALYLGYTSGAVYRLRGRRLKQVCGITAASAGLSFFSLNASNAPDSRPQQLQVFGVNAPFKRWSEYGSTLQADSAGFLLARGGVRTRYPMPIQPAAVIHACVTGSGLLCFGTRSGLTLVDPASPQPCHLFSDLTVSCITEDQEGGLWISTLGNGIYRLKPPFTGVTPPVIPNTDRLRRLQHELVASGRSGIRLLEQRRNRLELVPVRGIPGANTDLVYLDTAFIVYNDLLRDSTVYIDRITGRRMAHFRKSKVVFRSGAAFFSYGYSRDLFWYVSAKKPGFRMRTRGCLNAYIQTAGQRYSMTDDTARHPDTSDRLPRSGDVWFISDEKLYCADLRAGANRFRASDPLFRQVRRLYPLRRGLLLHTYDDQLWLLQDSLQPHARIVQLRLPGTIVSDLHPLSDTSALLRTGHGLVHATISPYGIRVRRVSSAGNPAVADFFAWRGRILRNSAFGLEEWETADRPGGPVYLRDLQINGHVYHSDSVRLKNIRSLDIRIAAGTISQEGNTLIEYSMAGRKSLPWTLLGGETLNLQLEGSGYYEIRFRTFGTEQPSYTLRIRASPPFTRSATFIILAAGAGLAVLILMLAQLMRARERRLRKAYEELQLRHRSTNALLNPHFVFNAISNIQGLIHEGAGAAAGRYLNELSRMIRQNMENLGQDLISLERELELIQAYIGLQNMRGGPPTSYNLHAGPTEPAAISVPPLILQTFVENAIVHGRNGNDPMLIELDLELSTDDYLIVTIRDNGRGIHDAMNAGSWNTNRMHLGIGFNRERLHRLNQVYGLEQSVSITDRSTSGMRGTEVVIILSLRLGQLFRETAGAAGG